MFTGIVEEVGRVRHIKRQGESLVLSIDAEKVIEDAKLGDSISVSGVCLTVTDLDEDGFSADVMKVTLDLTVLGELKDGDPVNLERAMSAQSRFGGHIVQGHVDGTAHLSARCPEEFYESFVFRLDDPDLSPFIVEHGSIAINGTSLTVAAYHANGYNGDSGPEIEIGLVPTSLEETMLSNLQPGDKVNIEVDVIAKYVQKMVAP